MHCRKFGQLIAIEGIDQSGKRTQAFLLAKELLRNGFKAAVWSFPDYSTPLGRQLRAYLAGRSTLDHHALHLLYTGKQMGTGGRTQERNQARPERNRQPVQPLKLGVRCSARATGELARMAGGWVAEGGPSVHSRRRSGYIIQKEKRAERRSRERSRLLNECTKGLPASCTNKWMGSCQSGS